MDVTNPTLKPYPAYKDSGVPSLGEIPTHWEMRPLKHWVTINKHVLPETTPPEYIFKYLDIGSVETGSLVRRPENLCFKDAPSRARRILTKGDTIISTVRTYLKAVYFVDKNETDLVASTGFAVLTPRSEVDPAFLSFLIRSNSFIDRVTANSVGIAYPAITETVMGGFHVAMPTSIDEQHHITAFLTHIDLRVNRLIRIKRRMVALLNEQKQAIIHRAVTRGLDPNVRLKPSGVAWLGQVPEHWEIIRSKRLFSARKDLSRPDDVQLSSTQAYGVIPQAKFEELVGRRVVKISMHLEKRRHVEKDDFVISMRSFQGGLERAWASGAIRSSYVVLKPQANVDISFFEYLFKSYGYIRALQATSDFIRDGQDLTYTDFQMVDLPLLPLDEQRAISTFIIQATAAIDTKRTRLEREIDLIREYRTRLVADVVTGKLDVRGVDLAAYGDELAGLDEALADEDDEGEEEIDEVEEDAG